MIRVRVIAGEYGKHRRGAVVEVREAEMRAAPWAFEPVEKETCPEPEPKGPPLFERLMEQDRANEPREAANKEASRRAAAERHVAIAMNLLGVKTSANPLALSLRLAALMGYQDFDGKGDALAWADENLERFVAWARASDKAASESVARVHELERLLAEKEKQLAVESERVADMERKLAAAPVTAPAPAAPPSAAKRKERE